MPSPTEQIKRLEEEQNELEDRCEKHGASINALESERGDLQELMAVVEKRKQKFKEQEEAVAREHAAIRKAMGDLRQRVKVVGQETLAEQKAEADRLAKEHEEQLERIDRLKQALDGPAKDSKK